MLGRKLKSNRGVSILMGLLLLLVCAVAGAAALTAAGSNAGRYTHLREDQQRYLAVASAVRLVRDELCAGEYNASATLRERYTYRYVSTGEDSGYWQEHGPTYTLTDLAESRFDGPFQPWLEDHLEGLFRAREVPGEWWGLDGKSAPADPGALKYEGLEFQVDAAEPILSQVKWTLELREDYSLFARFWLEADGARYYETTLTIPAQAEAKQSMDSASSSAESTTTTTQSLTVTWPASGAVIRQS